MRLLRWTPRLGIVQRARCIKTLCSATTALKRESMLAMRKDWFEMRWAAVIMSGDGNLQDMRSPPVSTDTCDITIMTQTVIGTLINAPAIPQIAVQAVNARITIIGDKFRDLPVNAGSTTLPTKN